VGPDPVLRRVERTAALACVVMGLAALAIARGRPGPAVAVFGGWLLIEIAFRSISSGINAMIGGLTGEDRAATRAGRRRHVAAAAIKLAGHYALLGFLAYVMIARLRLHPLGLIAGVSSAVAAVSVEAVRILVKKP
jgi:hypothetical protein